MNIDDIHKAATKSSTDHWLIAINIRESAASYRKMGNKIKYFELLKIARSHEASSLEFDNLSRALEDHVSEKYREENVLPF